MVLEDEESNTIKFCVPHHYEANVKAAAAGGGGGAGAQAAGRARRLAQEAVTLSTSLPLSYSSSVFVRCDEDRLDVMKVRWRGASSSIDRRCLMRVKGATATGARVNVMKVRAGEK
jgi:baculoviral IAP repeat-containing protein 6